MIDTTGTSAERRALPQQISAAALRCDRAGRSSRSRCRSIWPSRRPQAYIAALGTTRAAVLALFAGNPAAASAAPAIAARRAGHQPRDAAR